MGAPLPHVVFQDGKAYFGWGKAPQVLDRLLKAGRCAPAHLVFIPPVDRSREYHFNDAYIALERRKWGAFFLLLGFLFTYLGYSALPGR